MYPQGKQVLVLAPTQGTNGATTTALIDTLGYDFMSLDLVQTTSNDTTNNLSLCKLQECDTSNGTFADVSGTVGDTDWTIPAASTSAAQGYKFNLDLRHRKRYLKLSITGLTTQTFHAIANLFAGERVPVNATDAGVAALIGA